MPFPSPGNIPDPVIEPLYPALQANSLPSEPPGKPYLDISTLKYINPDSFLLYLVYFMYPIACWRDPVGYQWVSQIQCILNLDFFFFQISVLSPFSKLSSVLRVDVEFIYTVVTIMNTFSIIIVKIL